MKLPTLIQWSGTCRGCKRFSCKIDKGRNAQVFIPRFKIMLCRPAHHLDIIFTEQLFDDASINRTILTSYVIEFDVRPSFLSYFDDVRE